MNKKRFVKKLYGLGFSSFNGFSGCSEKEFLNTLRKIELPAGMSYENAFSTLKNLATPT